MAPPDRDRVETLSSQLRKEPAKNANNVPLLLANLPSIADKVAFTSALSTLSGFFKASIESGEIEGQHRKKQTKNKQPAGSELDPDEIYRNWLHLQYAEFKQQLLRCLTHFTESTLQIQVWDALMELVATECVGAFSNDLFEDMLTKLITSQNVDPEIVLRLAAKYWSYADARYYTLRVIQKVANACAKAPEGVCNWRSFDDLGPLLCGLLSRVPPNLDDCRTGEQEASEGEERRLKSWCCATEVDIVTGDVNYAENSQQRRKRRRDGAVENGGTRKTHVRWASEKLQKKMFSEAWISCLRLPLPEDVLIEVLSKLPGVVIPNMLDPLLLSDLLTAALNRGGLVGILALHGIFVLVTRHRLEYPQFYTCLYGLLKPEIFYSKQRVRFLQLTDIFLASVLVPAYTAAAFAKTFARFALTAPPSGAMICIAFIHNIIRRHPSCIVLLHRPQYQRTSLKEGAKRVLSGSQTQSQEGNQGAAERDELDQSGSGSDTDEDEDPVSDREAAGTQAGQPPGFDPFLPEEQDPAQSRAIESSLWEIEALRNHYCPQVAAFVSVLDKDMTDKLKTSEVDLEPLLLGSYASLIGEHTGKKLRRPPVVEFYSQWPTRLFGDKIFDTLGWSCPAAADGDESAPVVCRT
eukprot:evm.model.scf_1023.3 EVM.evm.TU.scf_1023.3   scf_1023:12077-20588(-)